MNQTETDKFNSVLREGYSNLIENRPQKAYEHYIYFLLDNVSEAQREIYPELKEFYEKYKAESLHHVKQLPE